MNLIICFTPLQVLIAERIIDLHPDEQFYGVMYSYTAPFSSKYQYYYERLASKCTGAEPLFGNQGNSTLEIIQDILHKIKKGSRLPEIKTIFIASLDIVDLHCFMHKLDKAEIKTFDDGTINLSPRAHAQILQQPKGKIHKLLGLFYKLPTPEDLLARSMGHFTIYKLPNVMGEGTFIDLIPSDSHLGPEDYTEIRSLFLGQPIYERCPLGGDEHNIEVTQRIIDDYKIEYYLPHPREGYKIDRVEYIETPYVFEDFILQERKRNPSVFYRVYTFCSSGMLNLANLSGLELIAIKPSDCPERMLETYNIFEKSGIKILNLQI